MKDMEKMGIREKTLTTIKRSMVMLVVLTVMVIIPAEGRAVCAEELSRSDIGVKAETVLADAAAPKASVTSKSLYTTSSAYKIKLENAASDAVIRYSSSDKTVAKVTSTGRIYPIAAGKATVTVKITQSGKSYSSKIKVTVKEPYIKITNTIEEISEGESVKLTVKGYGLTVGKLKWSSSNKKYATVSTAGRVTAKAAGVGKTVKLTAKDSESGKTCSISIKITAKQPENTENEAEEVKPAVPGKEQEATSQETGNKVSEERDRAFAVYSRLASLDAPDVTKLKKAAEMPEVVYSDEDTKQYTGETRIAGEGIAPRIAELMATEAETVNSRFSTEPDIRSRKQADEEIMAKAEEYSFFSLFIADAGCLRDPDEYLAMMPSIESITFSGMLVCKNAIDLNVSVKRNASLQVSDARLIDAVYTGNISILDKDEREAYDRIVELACQAVEYSDETERAKFLHDSLILRTEYDKEFETGTYGHTIAGCLNGNKCVCDGYAKSYYLLCNLCGIPCVLVSGDAGGGHIWNEINLGGKWYQVDVTWDDPVPDTPGEVKYNYFLLSDKTMAKDHYWTGETAPEALSDELNPLVIEYRGRMFDTESDGRNYILQCLAAGERKMEFILSFEDGGFAMCKAALKNYGYSIRMESKGAFGYLYSIEVS